MTTKFVENELDLLQLLCFHTRSMSTRVTMEELSRILGLSRNTVSKAINGNASVNPETRKKVLDLARELNYKAFLINDQVNGTDRVAIMALSDRSRQDNQWTSILFGIESIIRKKDAILQLKLISPHDLLVQDIPVEVRTKSVSGVILVGIYDKEYVHAIANCGMTVVSIDSFTKGRSESFYCDVIMPDSYFPFYSLTKELITEGFSRLGFVGDINLKASLNECWNGFRTALTDDSLPLDENLSIIKQHYAATESCAAFVQPWTRQWFSTLLPSLQALPEVFVCGEESIATNLAAALKESGKHIPQDILVTTVGRLADMSLIDPGAPILLLDTEEIGKRAAETLFWRVGNPERPFGVTYVPSFLRFTHQHSPGESKK